MPDTLEFYRSQADQCSNEAEATSLPRTREALQRAPRAWQGLADKLAYVAKRANEREDGDAPSRNEAAAR